MKSNDILIGLSDALQLSTKDMVEIFSHGDIEITEDIVQGMLINQNESSEEQIKCEFSTLESFLNGFIIYKRGKPTPKPGQPAKPPLSIKDGRTINNVMLKKLKIAFSLTSEDMHDIFEEGGVTVTKDKLSTLFRKEGHKHYTKCSDEYANAFINGLASLDL